MNTTHRHVVGDARDLSFLPEGSVHLVVTSPPYPMVAMWDPAFRSMAPAAGDALDAEDGAAAFEHMHRALDAAWAEAARVLAPGGLCCINIGDATRRVGGQFALYPNHARVTGALMRLGLTPLPDVLWRKPNNSPTKFLGSGMLPAGAYVTYEHEYVLIFRKGGRRVFGARDRARRRQSAVFWEERNTWYTDLWTGLPGVGQDLASGEARTRSAAFPLEVPRRLVHMHACYGDVVLDPFAGLGTTALAAAVLGRDSVSVDCEAALADSWRGGMARVVDLGARLAGERLDAHRRFVADRAAAGKPLKHRNAPHGLPVVTGQESDLEVLAPVTGDEAADGAFCFVHARAGAGLLG